MKNLKNNLSEKDTLINTNLGNWLRSERKKAYIVIDGKKRPITQTMVAKKLGVTFQQIQKYEKGNNTIPIFRWFALCDYFSVQPNTVKELVTSEEVINITENKTGDNNDNNDVCPKE
jgi:transcriptional regulator with XRE-family HTH domain